MTPWLKPAALAALLLTTLAGPAAAQDNVVNLYSHREPKLIQPMLDAFTVDTGVKVNVVFADKGMVERLKAEGANSPADLVLTVDAGRLNDLVDAGLVQPVVSDALTASVPAAFRHPDGLWYGLSLRGRAIFASRKRVPEAIAKGLTYADLADPKWKGKLCTRAGDHEYNVALLAAVIVEKGEAKAREWLTGLKANLARKPQGGDRDQVQAIYEGQCDLALANTYYYYLMTINAKQTPWADSARIVFPDQGGGGMFMNVSGIALTRSAPHRADATKLIEFLAGTKAQTMYAERNGEYPVNPKAQWSPFLRSLGTFKTSDVPLAAVAKARKAALQMINEVDYNS